MILAAGLTLVPSRLMLVPFLVCLAATPICSLFTTVSWGARLLGSHRVAEHPGASVPVEAISLFS